MNIRRLCTYGIVVLAFSGISLAQEPAPPIGPQQTPCGLPVPAAGPFRGAGRGFFAGGQWWKNADVVQKLKLSDSQVKQMEQVFQDHRLKLIDLHAALQREEVRLEPMITSDTPNENQVMAQIDKVAAQRANLEKANAQMAFSIRRVLTPEQWKTLQTLRPQRPGMGRGQGMIRGNRQGMHRMQRQAPPAPGQPAPPAPQQ
jgi:Spy/CpxP family protein refolding chaperone